MPTVTWLVEFDWANTGAYAANEAARTVGLRIERGGGGRFDAAPAGKAVITLENADRRFDPWYTASPLYPNVMPRRGVRIRAAYSGTTYDIFTGRIEEIEPSTSGGTRRVAVTAYDGLRDLADAAASVALQTDVAVDAAVDLVLTDADWPAGSSYRDLDPSAEVLGYWWRDSEASAKDSLTELFQAEHGQFFITAAGKARFLSRMNTTMGEALATLDEDHIVDIRITTPWESVINDVRIDCCPVALADLGVIWTLSDDSFYLSAGAQAELWAEYQDANGRRCAATAVVTPVTVTDFTANTAADGSGTNLTADLTVSAEVYSTWAKLTLENTGSTGFYVTLLQLRGEAIVQTPMTVRQEDATSQATYGRRQLRIATPWQQRVEMARDLALGLLNNYSEPLPPVTVVLRNRLPAMLSYELYDRITFTAPSYALQQLMQVSQITLATGMTMQELELELELEPAENQVSWLLGVAGKGELGVTTWCGY